MQCNVFSAVLTGFRFIRIRFRALLTHFIHLFPVPLAMSNLNGRPQKVSQSNTSKHPLAKLKKQYGGLNAYARHKQLINTYQLFYPSDKEKVEAQSSSSSSVKTAYDILKKNHKFLWNADDVSEAERSWDAKLAKRYYDKLFKEYCIADLSQYEKNRIAMRWRIEREVKCGKGQFICGEKRCNVEEELESWEVNFAYQEHHEKKNALVKLRLCPKCSVKLNFHSEKKRAVKAAKSRKRRKDSASTREKKVKRDESSSDSSCDSEDSCDEREKEETPTSPIDDKSNVRAEIDKMKQNESKHSSRKSYNDDAKMDEIMPSLIHGIFLQTLNDLSNPVSSDNHASKVGRCQTMCPQSELQFRSKNNLVHPLETATPFINSKRNQRKFIVEKAVKEYSRPAADKKVRLTDVRPFNVLVSTIEYLLEIIEKYQEPSQWPLVYTFVIDRFRAIRQDFIVQNLEPQQIVTLLEPMIPFYLNSRKKCIMLQSSVIDLRLHENEMEECFSRWLAAARDGAEVSSNITIAYAFYHLANPTIISELFSIFGESEGVFNLLRFAIQFFNGNSWVFFRTYKHIQIDYQRSALWIHFASMRMRALQSFRVAMGAPRVSYPIEMLADHLGFSKIIDLQQCLCEQFKISNALPIPFAFNGLVQLHIEKPSIYWFVD